MKFSEEEISLARDLYIANSGGGGYWQAGIALEAAKKFYQFVRFTEAGGKFEITDSDMTIQPKIEKFEKRRLMPVKDQVAAAFAKKFEKGTKEEFIAQATEAYYRAANGQDGQNGPGAQCPPGMNL